MNPTTFDEAIAIAASYEENIHDSVVQSRDISFEGNGSILLRVKSPSGSNDYGLTRTALYQCAAMTGVPSVYMARLMGGDSKDHEIALDCLNNGMRYVSGERMLRFRGSSVRAVLSPKYTAVSNVDALEMFRNACGGDGEIKHWRFDGDEMRFKAIVPSIGDSIRALGVPLAADRRGYSGGMSCGNSEVGTRAIGVEPFLFIAICENGVIVGMISGGKYRRIHIGDIQIGKISRDIYRSIGTMTNIIVTTAQRMLKLREIECHNTHVAPVLSGIRNEYRLTYPEIGGWFKAWHGAERSPEKDTTSAYSIFQGLTRFSQTVGVQDPGRQDDIETIAGRLVSPRRGVSPDVLWERRIDRAKEAEYDDSEASKIMGDLASVMLRTHRS